MNERAVLDEIQQALFSPPSKAIKLSEKKEEIKTRLQQAFTFWNQNPHLPDRKITNYLVNNFGVSASQALRDLHAVKYLLGCVKTQSREWYRHMVIEMCRSAYTMAKIKQDPKAMALAADKIGKYAKLDKDEIDELPWDQLIPPNFEPDADITILGIEKIPNVEKYRRRLRERTMQKYDPAYIQDAHIIDQGQEDEED